MTRTKKVSVALICVLAVLAVAAALNPGWRDDLRFGATVRAERAAGQHYEDAIAAYQKYLAAYPAGRHLAAAQAKVNRELPGLMDDRDWQAAQNTNSLEAYIGYLNHYAEGKWRSQAQDKVDNWAWVLPASEETAPGGGAVEDVHLGDSPEGGPSSISAINKDGYSYMERGSHARLSTNVFGSIVPMDSSNAGFFKTTTGLFPFLQQTFSFSPQTKQVGKLEPKADEVAGVYGNTTIAASQLGKSGEISIGVLCTPEREHLASICLCFKQHDKLYISPNYVVSPVSDNGTPNPDPQAYTVRVAFWKCADTLIVCRAGGKPMQIPCDSCVPQVDLPAVKRKMDSLDWRMERDGKTTAAGVIGFPVVGTETGLVRYRVHSK